MLSKFANHCDVALQEPRRWSALGFSAISFIGTLRYDDRLVRFPIIGISVLDPLDTQQRSTLF